MSDEAIKAEGDLPQRAGGPMGPLWHGPDAPEIGDWLHIAKNGAVTIFTGKVEVGQGSRTELTQVVAEELRVPLAAIEVVMGDTDRTPFDMGTFGSLTTPTMAAGLRRVAAATRVLLVDLAAKRWKVDPGTLQAAHGNVIERGTGRSIGYGELTNGRRLTQRYDERVPLTPPERWTIAGTSVPKVHARAIVTGTHRYTPDLKRRGMLYGKVLRPPAFRATLVALDTGAAEAIPGVVVVRDGDFVGVAAPDRAMAQRAIEAIRAQWTAPEQPSAADLFPYLETHPAPPQGHYRYIGVPRFERGDLAAGLAAGDHTLRARYTTAYIAHAPLETHAALAEWQDGKLTVWTGTQRPFGVREELAEACGIPPEQVRVIVPDTGAGYGGKHMGDAALEAARLAKGAGRPVSLVWTREEEFTWAYFRPASLIDVTSAVRKDGRLIAWEYHNYNSGPEAMATPYDVPNERTEFHFCDSPLRQGSYRALAAPANHFARETHMDELARTLGIDPLAFRLQNLSDQRLRAVFEAAADRFGWGGQKAPGHGAGIAGGTEKGSYVATCAEVAVDRTSGEVQVVRVVQAFECGAIINPDNLRNQGEGAIIQGLGGALFERIDFADGKILNPHFASYRVPRFGDVPAIDLVLVDRKDLSSAGAGETPICGIAPAVGNALYDATGIRLRSMPLVPEGLKEQK